MLCFEVYLDGQKVALAGSADWGVMNVGVSACRATADDTQDLFDFHIGGLSLDDDEGIAHHTRW